MQSFLQAQRRKRLSKRKATRFRMMLEEQKASYILRLDITDSVSQSNYFIQTHDKPAIAVLPTIAVPTYLSTNCSIEIAVLMNYLPYFFVFSTTSVKKHSL